MKNNKDVRIAVSIPLFNRLELFKKTVNSVLNQSVPPDEFIIVDNGSTDGCYEYALTLRKKGVKVFQNKTNIGMINNWNKAIEKAKCDYVVCLGSDDILLPDYIKVWKNKLNKLGKDVGAAFSGGYIIDGNDYIKGILKPFDQNIYLKPPETIKFFWDNYRFLLSVTGWTLFSREIIEKVGYFPTKYGMSAENGLSMKLLPKYPILYSSEVMFAFRKHGIQGFQREVVKFSSDTEVKNIQNICKVLRDYSDKSEIKKSFSKQEINNEIFVRKQVSSYLAQSLVLFIVMNIDRSKKFFKLFLDNYPKPYISFLTFKLLINWLFIVFKDQIDNIRIRLLMGKKPILDYF